MARDSPHPNDSANPCPLLAREKNIETPPPKRSPLTQHAKYFRVRVKETEHGCRQIVPVSTVAGCGERCFFPSRRSECQDTSLRQVWSTSDDHQHFLRKQRRLQRRQLPVSSKTKRSQLLLCRDSLSKRGHGLGCPQRRTLPQSQQPPLALVHPSRAVNG